MSVWRYILYAPAVELFSVVIDLAEKLILESSSQFVGNIKTKQLIIQEGAIFQGNCQMGAPQVAAQAARPAAQPAAQQSKQQPVKGPKDLDL